MYDSPSIIFTSHKTTKSLYLIRWRCNIDISICFKWKCIRLSGISLFKLYIHVVYLLSIGIERLSTAEVVINKALTEYQKNAITLPPLQIFYIIALNRVWNNYSYRTIQFVFTDDNML